MFLSSKFKNLFMKILLLATSYWNWISNINSFEGRWRSWGPWESCTVTCGIGFQTRYRDCGETPSNNCQEPFSEIRLCNAKVCPSKITCFSQRNYNTTAFWRSLFIISHWWKHYISILTFCAAGESLARLVYHLRLMLQYAFYKKKKKKNRETQGMSCNIVFTSRDFVHICLVFCIIFKSWWWLEQMELLESVF